MIVEVAITLAVVVAVASALPYEEGGPVKVLNEDNFDSIVTEPFAFVEFYAPWCGHCKSLEPAANEVAAALKGKSGAVFAAVDCDAHRPVCERFGVTGYPTLMSFKAGSLEADKYQGGRSADDILAFISKESGVKVKLAKPPSSVVVLTDENFDEIVLDETKDVLVEFYAPWCGHCKNLAPVYEQLATSLLDDVVIAKIDADSQREKSGVYGVTGFPTLIFFGKNSKSGEKYEGERSLSALLSFIGSKTDAKRSSDGSLLPSDGRVDELDDIVGRLVAGGNGKALLAEARASPQAELARAGPVYVKYIEKYVDGGKEAITAEAARIARVLEGGNLQPKKRVEFIRRQAVLRAFDN